MLNLDTLFKIAETSELLDRVEAQLRSSNQDKIANDLVKLQQDCGIEIDREMNGPDEDVAPGPTTAKLRAAYEPTSPERLSIIYDSAAAILDSDLKTELRDLIATLPMTTPIQPCPYPRP